MSKLFIALAASSTLLLLSADALAHADVTVSIGTPGVYAVPAPAPVYTPAAPVMVRPVPVRREYREEVWAPHAYPVMRPVPRHGPRGDQDRDGIPNFRDRDRDGDGIPNRWDRRPADPYRR
ncbi:hypothetical protein SAMN06265795_10365 [Noviherbaspirillum humi]|uniref:Uncharacterized protein n=1 Tax=Noviherbaspirillum humi TaxID=1688639 RepID=A0A239EZM4_9BURK|nr:hypothetical protein [Noviherbaspirillum humi]SNS49284.1 hypothetical protein SAMN06265795_10365 [Noviherbaspirillum humi]